MQFQGTEARVAELVAGARARMPELVEATVAAIRRELPVYGDQVHVTVDELRGSVVRNLDVAVRTLEGTAPPDLGQARNTGRVRARQGAPLPELVRAYRIGLTEVWRAVVAQLQDGRPGDLPALAAATSAIWDLADDYAEALTSAYRSASAELILAHQAERSVAAEALFAGGAAVEGRLWDVARVLGLPVEGEFVAVVAESSVLGGEPLPAIEARLRARNRASAWRLTPDLQAGVVELRRPDALGELLALLREGGRARAGLSPVFSGLGRTARGQHFARVALSTVPPGAPGVVQFSESPLAGLVASSPEESVQLARSVLAPLLDLPGDEGGVLVATLRAWFAAGGSTNATAQRLYCHPNTVRMRLRRITEELGRPLGDPQHVAELGAALRALDMFPRADQFPRPRDVTRHNRSAPESDTATHFVAARTGTAPPG